MTELKTNNPLALQLLMTDDLYRIAVPEEAISVTKEAVNPDPPVEYLGENNKYILILLIEPEQKIISPEDLKTLETILNARQLELRDVAIVNLFKNHSADFARFKEFFSCTKVILMGIDPEQIGLKDIESNRIHVFDETRILATYSFNEMRNNSSRKRVFWDAFKVL